MLANEDAAGMRYTNKRGILYVQCAAALLWCACAAGTARAQETAVVSVARANVRSAPSETARIVGALAKGADVTILDSSGSWMRIRASTVAGWMSGRLLSRRGVAPARVEADIKREEAPPAGTATEERPREEAQISEQVPPKGNAAKRSASAAASGETQGFTEGGIYLGPRVWLGVYGTLAFGGQLEYGLTPPHEELGGGRFGFAVSADVYSYDAYVGAVTYRVIPVTALATFHFAVEDKRIDPFVGLGLGFYSVSASYPGGASFGALRGSALFATAQLGARYFFRPRLAAQAQAGLGLGVAAVGLTWKM